MQADRHPPQPLIALAGTDLAELRTRLDTRTAAARQAVRALTSAHNRHLLSVDAALDFALAFVTARR